MPRGDRQAQALVNGYFISRRADPRREIIRAWAEFDARLDQGDLVIDRQWSRSLDRAIDSWRQRDTPLDEATIDAFVANIAILLARRKQIDYDRLAQLVSIDHDSSLHLSYRQGMSIAAQHGYYDTRAGELRDWIDHRGSGRPEKASIAFAIFAQVGQLGQALTGAKVAFGGIPAQFNYLEKLAEDRLDRLIGSAFAAAADGDWYNIEASPSTVCLIGALRGLADYRLRNKMIDFVGNRDIIFDNQRITRAFGRSVALPIPVPHRYYPYPSFDQGKDQFVFSGGMIAFEDPDRDRHGSAFSYLALNDDAAAMRHGAAHESIHAASALPYQDDGLDHPDHRGIGLALEEAAADTLASIYSSRALGSDAAYYDYQQILRQIAEQASITPSRLALKLLVSPESNYQIINQLEVPLDNLDEEAYRWVDYCNHWERDD